MKPTTEWKESQINDLIARYKDAQKQRLELPEKMKLTLLALLLDDAISNSEKYALA